jgi:hypothetical protein
MAIDPAMEKKYSVADLEKAYEAGEERERAGSDTPGFDAYLSTLEAETPVPVHYDMGGYNFPCLADAGKSTDIWSDVTCEKCLQSEGNRSISALVQPGEPQPPNDPAIYACVKCGKMRTKTEGGTTFSVCDECWDKNHPKQPQTPSELAINIAEIVTEWLWMCSDHDGRMRAKEIATLIEPHLTAMQQQIAKLTAELSEAQGQVALSGECLDIIREHCKTKAGVESAFADDAVGQALSKLTAERDKLKKIIAKNEAQAEANFAMLKVVLDKRDAAREELKSRGEPVAWMAVSKTSKRTLHVQAGPIREIDKGAYPDADISPLYLAPPSTDPHADLVGKIREAKETSTKPGWFDINEFGRKVLLVLDSATPPASTQLKPDDCEPFGTNKAQPKSGYRNPTE